MAQGTLRKARPEDAELARSLIGELGYAGLDEQTFSRGFRAVLADAAQQVWLAEEGGQVVGLMSISTRPQVRFAGCVVSIDELVVTARARGGGIGAKMLELAKAEATRVGARRLELHTARKRPSYERGFYVKNGFAEIDSAVLRWEGGLSAIAR
jgi:N-acetylglutamate synthase-like GNAT family acetyltransferase